MSNDRVREKLHEISQEELVSFVMPVPMFGQPVAWHHNASRGRFELGFIIGISRRNVTVRLLNGKVYSSVRHIDDPKLLLSHDEQRENGAWAYTEHSLALAAERIAIMDEISSLRARLASLEDGGVLKIADPTKPKRAAKGNTMKARWALIKECQSLGIEANIKSEINWMKQQIAVKRG